MDLAKKQYQCLVVDDEPTAIEILEQFIAQVDQLQLVASCESAMEAFQWINSEKIDLIFLDIHMPEISGLSFAKSIAKNHKIIFTTAYREYALDGFDLMAVDYLVKPIAPERFMQAIGKYLGEQMKYSHQVVEKEGPVDDFIFVRADRKMIRLPFDTICYVESYSDYIKIYCTDQKIVCRETISNLQSRLPLEQFLRIHRSYLVAPQHIHSFTNEYIEIANQQLPISRTYKTAVLERLYGVGK